MAKKKDFDTHELNALVQKKFAKKEGWVTLFEVSDRTPNPLRRADVIAFNIWNTSQGTKMWGMEIKSSRADWLNELEDPDKAETFKKYCHHWFLVSPEHIVKEGELPEGWGHLIPSPRGATLREKVKAPLLEPIDIPREFLTVLIRSSFDMNNEERNAITHNEEKRWKDYYRSVNENEISRRQKELDKLRERVKVFEAFSGIRIDTFDEKQVQDIGKLLYQSMTEPRWIPEMVRQLQRTKDMLDQGSKGLGEIIEENQGRAEDEIFIPDNFKPLIKANREATDYLCKLMNNEVPKKADRVSIQSALIAHLIDARLLAEGENDTES